MKTSILLSMLMGCASTHATVLKAHKPVVDRPNIIYIYADDMGMGMLSAYGQRQFTTPNIDRLVRRGTSFSRAYGCMLSAPSRASLLTGYHDCHGTDKWNISGGGAFVASVEDTASIAATERRLEQNEVCLPEGDLYLPQVFKAAGYATAQIGKLEWGFTATRNQMRRHGWDYYYGYLDHVRCHGFYPPFLFDNGRIVEISGNTHKNCGKSIEQETPETLAERWDRNGKAVYSQDIFLDKILAYMREHKDEPFFLFHPTQLPHGPVAIPAIHPEVASNPALTTIEKEYASMVKMLDDHVGRILAELERLGIARRTIVVFAADNGHEIYYARKGRCEKPYRNLETGRYFDDFDDKFRSKAAGDVFNGNAGMAGLKRSNLEGGVHIPLVVYGPGMIPSGVVSSVLVTNYDFLPTVADGLGVRLASDKDGRSYLSVLFKGTKKDIHPYVVFGSNQGPAIVTKDGWKLRYYLPRKTVELFNLNDDPEERHNLAGKYPKKVKTLQELLLKECGGDIRNGVNRAG